MELQHALTLVKAAGYKVSKPKTKVAAAPKLNCLGLPMSPSFDPNYRMKYRTPPLSRKQHVSSYLTPEKWAAMCAAQGQLQMKEAA